MTPRTIIASARTVINDTDSVLYRQSDTELLKYVNDGLKEASMLSPGDFISTGDYACVQDQTEQKITFIDGQALLSVIRVKNGPRVHFCDDKALSQFNPDWEDEDAGPAVNWMRMPQDKLRFYIYPKAPSMQTLEVSYLRNPKTYGIDEEIDDCPETWEPALADYVIYRAESKDDEHAVSGRAASHYQAFTGKIKGGV